MQSFNILVFLLLFFFCFFEKIRFDIYYESSTWQTIHMK